MRLSETARDVKIVDKLSLLTEYFINRITYYISQGRVEAPIRICGKLCCSTDANLLQYLCAENYQNTMQFDKVIAKIKGCNFCPTVYIYDLMTLKQGCVHDSRTDNRRSFKMVEGLIT